MLGALFRFLNTDIFGNEKQKEGSHPFFGEIVHYSFKDPSKNYWECEVPGDNGTISIGIDSPSGSLPNDEQVRFSRSLLDDPDAAFDLVAPLVKPEFETNYQRDFPAEWRQAFRLAGFTVPASALRTEFWDLTFECIVDPHAHHFTCYFENGAPTAVTIDG